MPPPMPASGDTIHVMYAYGWVTITVCPCLLVCQYNKPKRPGDLDLLTLKVVSESCVTWVTSVPILVFLGLSVLELGPMYATDRQTDRCQTKASLNASALWGLGIIICMHTHNPTT